MPSHKKIHCPPAGRCAAKADPAPRLSGRCLERLGVEHVFGYPGGAILPTYDALTKSRVHHVLVRHEQGATHMADGYARASGRVGVALATSGPGATNMVTGIATAMMDSSPIVCITGQVGSTVLGSDAFQEVDITGITLPITKHNYIVTRATKWRQACGRPFTSRLRTGRDRCWWTSPRMRSSVRANSIGKRPRRGDTGRFRISSPVRRNLPKRRRSSTSPQRPVILAGHGMMVAGAEEEVRRFAETADIPVALTLLGLGGFPASRPLNLGMMGMHGEAWVNQAIQESDLLIALGMRFDDRVTGKLNTYAPKAKKIHVEIDRAEINKNIHVDVPLIGDLREVLSRLLPGIRPARHSAWWAQIHSSQQDSAVRDIQNLPDNGHLYAAHVLNDLWRETHGDAVIVTDVGRHQMWEAPILPS